uniref:Uncharacterized protein n=1 Tax=Cucumis melo TaxID=3656 RepID=A0A9I9DTL4_CUCME
MESVYLEYLTFLDLTKQGKNKSNHKMAAGGSGSGQPQFLVRAGDENFSHAPLIENPETDQIIVPDLLWIILVASFAALIIQSLAANLGVVTGKHLAEHCKAEYPKAQNFILWVLAEIAIVACDIPEVIGTAFALNMLFRIPVWCGVLLTGLSTLLLLALQQYGIRKLEFLIAFLVLTIAVCFFLELGYAKPDVGEIFYGLFVPQLKGSGATGLAISLLGAMEACRFYMIESGFALMVAFLINVSVISVSGAVCNSPDLNKEDQMSCNDLDLNKASFLLRVCVIYLKTFLKSRSTKQRKPYMKITVLTWIIGLLIMAINIYYLMSRFIHVLLHNDLHLAAVVSIGILGFSGVALYLSGIAYLVFRKTKEISHLLALTTVDNRRLSNEPSNRSRYDPPNEDTVSMQLPQRIRSTNDVN